MGGTRAFLVAVLSVSLGSSAANAAFVFSTGTLNASSSVTHTPSGTNNTHSPAAVVMSSGTASHSTAAVVQGVGQASGSTGITLGPNLKITANSNFSWQSNFVNSNATVSGTATFHETVTELAEITFTASPNRGVGSVTLKNASNQTIAELKSAVFGGGDTLQPLVVGLTPGLYTVNWTWSTIPFVGTGGATGMSFNMFWGVPEPTGVALLVPAAMSLLARRPRRK